MPQNQTKAIHYIPTQQSPCPEVALEEQVEGHSHHHLESWLTRKKAVSFLSQSPSSQGMCPALPPRCTRLGGKAGGTCLEIAGCGWTWVQTLPPSRAAKDPSGFPSLFSSQFLPRTFVRKSVLCTLQQ